MHDLTDAQVEAALAAQGVAVSARQRRRWREEGVLPAGRRRGMGRGKGTVVVYPRDTVAWAAVLARITRPGIHVADAVMVAAIAHGEPVPPELVGQAVRLRLGQFLAGVEAHVNRLPALFRSIWEGLGPFLHEDDMKAMMSSRPVRRAMRDTGAAMDEVVVLAREELPDEPLQQVLEDALRQLATLDGRTLRLLVLDFGEYPQIPRTADGVTGYLFWCLLRATLERYADHDEVNGAEQGTSND